MSDATASSDRLARALGESEGFQLLARALPDAVLVLDADGGVVYASVQSATLFGRPASDLLGVPFLDLVAEDDRSAFPPPPHRGAVGAWDFRPDVPGELPGELPGDRWLNAALLTPRL